MADARPDISKIPDDAFMAVTEGILLFDDIQTRRSSQAMLLVNIGADGHVDAIACGALDSYGEGLARMAASIMSQVDDAQDAAALLHQTAESQADLADA